MVAENGSKVFGLAANLHLRNDDFRIKAGGAYADIRYRYYGVGNDVGNQDVGLDILQKGPLYFASGNWRVWKRLYVGLGYLSGTVNTRLRGVLPGPPLPPLDQSSGLDFDVSAYTIPIEIDSRDHQQFPRNGWLIKGTNVFYRKSVGSDFNAETYKISINRYLPVAERDVFAYRFTVGTVGGDVPFFLMSSFGGSTDLRGYPSGRYRDRVMYAAQGEYRWQFNDSWIFTGFAGVGEVAENPSDFGRNFLPAAGVGARFVLSQKHRVSLSVDFAVGKDGNEFYFGVGEAF